MLDSVTTVNFFYRSFHPRPEIFTNIQNMIDTFKLDDVYTDKSSLFPLTTP
jgi:hypothetical protein